MKAIVFHEHGGLEKLRYEERPDPKIEQDEVLVRVKACALNHLDIWIRQGVPGYPLSLPHISGCDVAGVVEQVGTEVANLAVGDRVYVSPGLSCWQCKWCRSGRDNLCQSFKILGAQVDGGYAERVKAPGADVLPMPASLTFEQAAAFPLVSLTAWHMLLTLGGLRPGETVLVMGAGSGVGSIAIQIARLAGARVITTVGADEKIPKARALGADDVINHAKEDIPQRIKELTGGTGVDLIIEHIGPEVWEACIRSMAKGGRLVTCGATTGAEATMNLRYLFTRQLTIKGSYMGTRGDLLQAAELIGQGQLKPVVDRVFPLKEARAAQEYLLARKVFGKLVLSVE
ncbi:MAG: zinc-binding dehydrogenase [Nitrospiraceae bacterium]